MPVEGRTRLGDRDEDENLDLKVRFNRRSLIDLLKGKEVINPTWVTVDGFLDDGTYFVGEDSFRVIKRGKGKK